MTIPGMRMPNWSRRKFMQASAALAAGTYGLGMGPLDGRRADGNGRLQVST